jgi:hypothetical protein
MKSWTNEEWQELVATITQRAAADPEFRTLALRDGAAAIAKVSSKPLPDGITCKFVDNSGNVKTIPLPDPLPNDSEELSESDLEDVAGGSNPPPPNPPVSGGWSKIAPLQRLVTETKQRDLS